MEREVLRGGERGVVRWRERCCEVDTQEEVPSPYAVDPSLTLSRVPGMNSDLVYSRETTKGRLFWTMSTQSTTPPSTPVDS